MGGQLLELRVNITVLVLGVLLPHPLDVVPKLLHLVSVLSPELGLLLVRPHLFIRAFCHWLNTFGLFFAVKDFVHTFWVLALPFGI